MSQANNSDGKYKPFKDIAFESGDELLLAMNTNPDRCRPLLSVVLLAVLEEVEAGRIQIRENDQDLIFANPGLLETDAQHLFRVRYRIRHYLTEEVRRFVERETGRYYAPGKAVDSAIDRSSKVVTFAAPYAPVGGHKPKLIDATPVETPAMYGTW